MDVHKITCSNNHEFFLTLDLPRPIEEIAVVFKTVTCPLCQAKPDNLKIHAQTFTVSPKPL